MEEISLDRRKTKTQGINQRWLDGLNMNSRLRPQRLTSEDLHIWRDIDKKSKSNKPWAWGMIQDRRDADLMKSAQESPLARFISNHIDVDSRAASMVTSESNGHRWLLVRCTKHEFYPDQPDITNCA
jgi:hypothetical protein